MPSTPRSSTWQRATAKLRPVVVVGAPIRSGARLYNCAVVLHRGEVLGVVPKVNLPNYREFYEKRWFASGDDARGTMLTRAHWPGADEDGDVPFGPDLIFRATDLPDLTIHVEVCEDMWVPIPPSARAALAGAHVLLNLSASPITVARAEDRHLLARSASSRCNAAYLYAAASAGESTTDLSWDGMTMAYEMGDLLGQSARFPEGAASTVVDIDLDRLRQERIRQGSFDDNRRSELIGTEDGELFRVVEFDLQPAGGDLGLRRPLDRFPFVPDDEARLALDCYEAYNIQVSGLEQRLRAIAGGSAGKPLDPQRAPKIVIGVSGGLDSTHALIVAAKACDRLGLPRTHILGFTMPGFATSKGTKSNAITLMESLAITWEELDIRRPPLRCSRTSATPPARARRSTTSPSRTSRPACAPTSSSAPPTSAAASSWGPATCPSWRSAGAPMASATRCRTTASTPASPRPSCST
jgi:NAD+ synthase (glutamine-hydrolysing)